MSNRRRPRVVTPPTPGPGETWATQIAVVYDRLEPGQLEQARKLSHDALIRKLGPQRRSGIWWTQMQRGEALANIDQLVGCDDPDHHMAERVTTSRDEARKVIEENTRCLVVIAWALAAVPPGVIFE